MGGRLWTMWIGARDAIKQIIDFGSNPLAGVSDSDALAVVTLQSLQKKVYYIRLYIMIIAFISLALGISVQVPSARIPSADGAT